MKKFRHTLGSWKRRFFLCGLHVFQQIFVENFHARKRSITLFFSDCCELTQGGLEALFRVLHNDVELAHLRFQNFNRN